MYIATFTAVVPSYCEPLEPYYAVECDVINISKDISAIKTSGTTHPMAEHHTNVQCKYNRVVTLKQVVHTVPQILNTRLLYWWYHLIILTNIPINMTTAHIIYIYILKIYCKRNLSDSQHKSTNSGKNSSTPLRFMQRFQSKQNSFLGH